MKKLIFTCLALLIRIGLFAQIPEVPNTQMSLVTKHTATWCPICGREAWDTQKFFMDNLDGAKAIVLSAHISNTSRLYSQTAKELLNTFQSVVYQPEFFFNTSKVTGTDEEIKTNMVNRVNQAAQQTPLAQTGIIATYNPATNNFRVRTRTRFFAATEGEFQLSILLVERRVTEQQAARTNAEVHRNVIRQALTANTFGSVITSGNIPAGREVQQEISTQWDDRYKLDNIEVVTILWRRNATRYEFVNANFTATVQPEQTTFAPEADALGARFVVQPNLAAEVAYLRLDLPTALDQAEIGLFDRYGRQVRTLHRGSLPAGEQQILLHRMSAETAGVYFVRFRAGAMVATRRVIFF